VKPVLLSADYVESEFENDLRQPQRHRHHQSKTQTERERETERERGREGGKALEIAAIPLQHRMCFEDVYRRNVAGGGHHFYGAVHPTHIQRFRETAFRVMNRYVEEGKPVFVPASYWRAYHLQREIDRRRERHKQRQRGNDSETERETETETERGTESKMETTAQGFVSLKGLKHFLSIDSERETERETVVQMLIAYRGPKASRYLSNIDALIRLFESEFAGSSAAHVNASASAGAGAGAGAGARYVIHSLNTSDNTLSFQQQLLTIAPCQVVVTNHGAYESNLLYLRNGSLLIEIAGEYENQEFHSYEQMAQMFGLFYGRVHVQGLTSHDDRQGQISDREMQEIVRMVSQYLQHRQKMKKERASVKV